MKLLRSILLFQVCLFFSASFMKLNAQYGVRAKINFDRNANINSHFDKRFGTTKNVFAPGYELGVDYWFKLKKKRIEFLPEVAYYYSNTTLKDGLNANANRFIFNFNTQIYALDLKDDCNCPTFAKQGPSINKGFFLNITPGISFQTARFTADATIMGAEKSEVINKHLNFHFGLGLGLDIGINELITITPMASYFFNGSKLYDLYVNSVEEASVETSFTQLQFQVRTGFRFDYKSSVYKRRR
ncbi:MAG: hypothetical protein IPL20_04150 [Saprospiraceae bacterium]|nr:hypothetical protein [Saprospiraceae bacterium]